MGSTVTDGGPAVGPPRGGWFAPFLRRAKAADGGRPFRIVEAGHPIPPGAVVTLVASGWARAETPAYTAAESDARSHRRGIWLTD